MHALFQCFCRSVLHGHIIVLSVAAATVLELVLHGGWLRLLSVVCSNQLFISALVRPLIVDIPPLSHHYSCQSLLLYFILDCTKGVLPSYVYATLLSLYSITEYVTITTGQ